MNDSIKNSLIELTGGRVQFGVRLSEMTTFRLGGKAGAFFEPAGNHDLTSILAFTNKHGLKRFVLGGGSNVIFSDHGFDGVVIRLGSGFETVKIVASSGDEVSDQVEVYCGAAALTAALVRFTRDMGLSGLEFMVGIPGRIGGALAMNAGAYRGEILDATKSIEIVSGSGEEIVLEAAGIDRKYRGYGLPKGSVITGGFFQLQRDAHKETARKMDEILAARAGKLPLHLFSAGSVFKNPPGDKAGRLVDQAGLKGRREGGAWIAEEHGNFIVHDGEAKSEDVIKLVKLIQTEVKRKFGVTLNPEIRIVGFEGDV